MSVLQQRIDKARAERRYALIPFITAGFPDMEGFRDTLHQLDDNGADIIEVGVPFSDPVADGPVVEEASRKALLQGMSLKLLLAELADLRPGLRAGLVLMGYYNPFLQYGLRKLADECVTLGVEGLIVPDLPIQESAAFRAILRARAIDLIPLVGPNTSAGRMHEYKRSATGYVYVVSLLGTTGARAAVPLEAGSAIARAREVFGSLPLALGFGLTHPGQIKDLSHKPDALVFGSSLMLHLHKGGSAGEFMRLWSGQ